MGSVNRLFFVKSWCFFACFAGSALAGSNPNCYQPPGYYPGTAKWDANSSKLISSKLITPSGSYECLKPVPTTRNPELPGYKNYWKTACGPMALVSERTYRSCTLEEMAGISSGYGTSGQLKGALKKYSCATSNNVAHSERLELIDKAGARFELGRSYHYLDGIGELGFTESCTATLKTTTTFRKYRLGDTSVRVTLEDVRTEEVRMIAQPRL